MCSFGFLRFCSPSIQPSCSSCNLQTSAVQYSTCSTRNPMPDAMPSAVSTVCPHRGDSNHRVTWGGSGHGLLDTMSYLGGRVGNSHPWNPVWTPCAISHHITADTAAACDLCVTHLGQRVQLLTRGVGLVMRYYRSAAERHSGKYF